MSGDETRIAAGVNADTEVLRDDATFARADATGRRRCDPPCSRSAATSGLGTVWVAIDGDEIAVFDRGGRPISRFGRSIRALEERAGIVYTLDTAGMMIWDRERGVMLAEEPTRTGSHHRLLEQGFGVSPDGKTVVVADSAVVHRWQIPFETGQPDAVAAALSAP